MGRSLGRRWYPTGTAISTRKLLCTSGGNNSSSTPADIPLLLDAGSAAGSQYQQLTAAEQFLNWYPFVFELSSGRVFMGGSHYYNATLDMNDPESSLPVPSLMLDLDTQAWASVADSPIKGGSAVMYAPDRVMKAGGGLSGAQGPSCGDTTVSNRAMTIDLSDPNPAWTEIAPMNSKRLHFYLVALPDGSVLAVGATQTTEGGQCNAPVLAAEIYDPGNPAAGWKVMANMAEARMYHSIALLLPDARVLVAGGQHSEESDNDPQRSAQVFSPPYLFGSDGTPLSVSERPSIECLKTNYGLPIGYEDDVLLYGAPFKVCTRPNEAAEVTRVSLIRLGAATHSFDQDQRAMELSDVTVTSPGELAVVAPATPRDAPPGYYMVFILDDGVPSVARIVKLSASSPNCTPAAEPIPDPDPDSVEMNRFIAFANPNSGTSAIRVTLTSLYHPDDPVPAHPPDFGCFEEPAQHRWLGPPEVHWLLQEEPPNPLPLATYKGIYAPL